MGKIIDVQITPEHIDRNAKASPKEVIKELIWNSCDADATFIEVSFEYNFFGNKDGEIESIAVRDNGHGIKYEDMETLFGLYGRSNKTYSDKSPKGRVYHGKQGHGRYKSFSIGTFVKWESIYVDEDGKKYRFFIDFDPAYKMKCICSDKELMSDSTDTGVIVTISGIMQSVAVLSKKEIMIEEIMYAFAPYLLAYNDVVINYEGVITILFVLQLSFNIFVKIHAQ